MAKVVSLFGRGAAASPAANAAAAGADPLPGFLTRFSIEVMPRTAAKVADFPALLPRDARVYIAHLDGVDIADMVATAARLRADGFEVTPHFPARIIPDRAALAEWAARYRDVGVDQALVLAGGVSRPVGAFSDSMQLLESGVFDAAGFTRLFVAGHPEGNRDIDPDGGDRAVLDALRWKQAFRERTDADMAITTQFAFEAGPVIAWAERLREAGFTLPIHIGAAGPAKLQTLIKFAIACGVGPSLRVLQRRAADMTKLLAPFEPTEFLRAIAARKAQTPELLIEQAHLFPLGGVAKSAEWAAAHRAPGAEPAAQAL